MSMSPHNLLFGFIAIISTINCAADIVPGNVSPSVMKSLAKNTNPTNVIVQFRNDAAAQTRRERTIQEITELVQNTDTRSTKNKAATTRLTEHLNHLQGIAHELMSDVILRLEELETPFEVIWISNLMYISNITRPILFQISAISSVTWIRLEKKIPSPIPPKYSLPQKPRPPPTGNSTWNLGLIDARCKEIQDVDCYGRGVIVAVIDTGVLWDHDELKANWLGLPYGGLDASGPTSEDDVPGYPYDLGAHGTHVTATIVGATVGVAPNAQWMGCRVQVPEGYFGESALLLCGQFVCAPWRYDDYSQNKTTKNVTMRAHVVNNSWSSNGGSVQLNLADDFYYKVVELWTALGIIHFFSNGNKGPGCGTTGAPGAYDTTFSVGAVDYTTTAAYFSSRGPVIMANRLHVNSTANASLVPPVEFPILHTEPSDGHIGIMNHTHTHPQTKPCIAPSSLEIPTYNSYKLIKPDISGPGVDIRSAWGTGPSDYNTISGTSMATPHLCGIAALMICTKPGAHWTQQIAYKILTETADTGRLDLKGDSGKYSESNSYKYLKNSHILCNKIAGEICNGFPNNVYGHGLAITCDAVVAVKAYFQNH